VDWSTEGYLYKLDGTGISFELKGEVLYALIGEIAEVEFYLDHHLEPAYFLVNSL
jgi:hypothetical protein